MFADDTNCFMTGKDLKELSQKLNQELSKIVIWLKANKLSLNIDKTHYMLFQPKKTLTNIDIELRIENNLISKVDHCKFLGVIIDEKLSWNKHVTYIRNKLAKVTGILFRCRVNLCFKHLHILYNSLFEPYLFYCCMLWTSASAKILDPLIKIQKVAIRCICFLSKYTSTAEYFKRFDILNLKSIRMYATSLFMYNFHHKSLPNLFNSFFQYNFEIHSRTTRQVNLLHPPRYKSNFSKCFVKYYGVILWNELCLYVNPNQRPSVFKRQLRRYILSK